MFILCRKLFQKERKDLIKVIVFMIRLTRYGNNISYECENHSERTFIEKSLTVKHDNPYFVPAFRSGHWDGLMRFYDKKMQTFPFGLIETVVTDLDKAGYEYQIDGVFDIPYIPTSKFKSGDKFEGTALHQHQVEALNSFYEIKHGIIKVSTRGGKTYIASEAIRQTLIDFENYNYLFLVESELLFDQAIDDISAYLKISKTTIGKIKGEKIEIKQITIAMIQTISNIDNFKKRLSEKYKKLLTGVKDPNLIKEINFKKRLENKEKIAIKNNLFKYFDSVNFLIVDECHEFSNDNRIEIIQKIQKINCDFNLFLSATPFKSEKPLGNLNLQKVSGPVIYTIHESVLKERGILASDKILLFMFNHDDNKNIDVNDESSYGDYQREVITHNERRNQVLVNVVETCRKLRLKTLVLFIYKKHAHHIQSITGDTFLCSDDKMEVRKSTIKTFLKRKGDVLFASGIFKKGLTLPEVQILFNAGGGLEQSEIIQKKGRVLGVKGTKNKALIIDFIDMSKYFNEHSLSRISVYESSVKPEDIIVLDAADSDFYKDIKEFLHNWFEI